MRRAITRDKALFLLGSQLKKWGGGECAVASLVLQMLASDYGQKCGDLQQTSRRNSQGNLEICGSEIAAYVGFPGQHPLGLEITAPSEP